jgi:hypothetical protein
VFYSLHGLAESHSPQDMCDLAAIFEGETHCILHAERKIHHWLLLIREMWPGRMAWRLRDGDGE